MTELVFEHLQHSFKKRYGELQNDRNSHELMTTPNTHTEEEQDTQRLFLIHPGYSKIKHLKQRFREECIQIMTFLILVVPNHRMLLSLFYIV